MTRMTGSINRTVSSDSLSSTAAGGRGCRLQALALRGRPPARCCTAAGALHVSAGSAPAPQALPNRERSGQSFHLKVEVHFHLLVVVAHWFSGSQEGGGGARLTMLRCGG
jgi:hypothetical protein